MTSSNTKVFFVPYRPPSSSKKLSSDDSTISRQKHAAREYHRKAKLQRLADFNISHTRHARSQSDHIQESLPSSSSRRLLPRKKGRLTDKDDEKPPPVLDVGTGHLDPFNVCVPTAVPPYVLEMLDHGKFLEFIALDALSRLHIIAFGSFRRDPFLNNFRSLHSSIQHFPLPHALCLCKTHQRPTDVPFSVELPVASVWRF